MQPPKPILLLILDGWGLAPDSEYNAISQANTPNWDKLWNNSSRAQLVCHGTEVGLPDNQMGNSEVGHITIGSGRIVDQDLTKINKQITSKSFFNNHTLNTIFLNAETTKQNIHLIGLLSDGGVHSHIAHIIEAIDLANKYQVEHIYLHVILDGRDTPPKSAHKYLSQLEDHIKSLKKVSIATVMGRFFAMDRDKRFDRTQQAFDAIVHGQGQHVASNATQALDSAYLRNETDEFVAPTCIVPPNQNFVTVRPLDSVVFMNFRADRAKQLSYALTQPEYDNFDRGIFSPIDNFATLTSYGSDLKAQVAYPASPPKETLGEILENNNLNQLRIAETEKYAHVTYFFDGGLEQEFARSERILIPSPKVTTYDKYPQMSAYELTDELIAAINKKQFDCIIVNFANPDMVGHTGNFAATVEAIEVIDECLGKITQAIASHNGALLLTADHGNCEAMYDTEANSIHTAHTKNPAPLVYYGNRDFKLQKNTGSLKDIAPSILHLLGIAKPSVMSGDNLFVKSEF